MDEDFNFDAPICVHCGSTNLYRDGDSDDLICIDCNTQSQAYSQRETAEDAEGLTAGKKKFHNAPKSKSVVVADDEIHEDYAVPTLMEFTEAFLELIESAARRSVSEELMPTARLNEFAEFENFEEDIVRNAKEIWCLFLERFDETANYFMRRFPGFRISLKDRFMTRTMRIILWKQLIQSFRGKVPENEGEYDYEYGNEYEEDGDGNDDEEEDGGGDDDDAVDDESDDDDDEEDYDMSDDEDNDLSSEDGAEQQQFNLSFQNHSTSSGGNNVNLKRNCMSMSQVDIDPKGEKKYLKIQPLKENESPFTSWKKLMKILPLRKNKTKDEKWFWKMAIAEIFPDLNLATAIVYLAHLYSQTGISSNHFVAWANMGLYPHLLDGYGQLTPQTQHTLRNVKMKWYQSRRQLPNPEFLDDLASVLLTCLVDPSEQNPNSFLADLFALNVNRLLKIPYWNSKQSPIVISFLRNKLLELNTLLRKKKVVNSSLTPGSHNEVEEENNASGLVKEVFKVPKTFYNVGLMVHLFCAHLGLEDRVLDFAYALMGFPVYCSETTTTSTTRDEWLPAPLKLAQPCMIITPLHALAVIVVACKLVPGWDKWVIQLVDDGSDKSNKRSKSDAERNNPTPNGKRKRRKTLSVVEQDESSTDSNAAFSPLKFSDITYNDSQGDRALKFLDFIPKEDIKKSKDMFQLQNALSWMEQNSPQDMNQTGVSVKGRTILGDCSLVKNIPYELSSSFGLCDYYAETMFNNRVSGVYNAYATLLSYIKDRLYVDEHKLHFLVTRLDYEMRRTSRKLYKINKEIAGNHVGC